MIAPNLLEIGDRVVSESPGVTFTGYVHQIDERATGCFVEVMLATGGALLTVSAPSRYDRVPLRLEPQRYRDVMLDTPIRVVAAMMHAFGVVGAIMTWPNGGRSPSPRVYRLAPGDAL